MQKMALNSGSVFNADNPESARPQIKGISRILLFIWEKSVNAADFCTIWPMEGPA